MMRRHLTIAVCVLGFWCASARADETQLLLIRSGAPAGVTVLDAGTTSATQTIIPRYANGASGTAGSLLGWGSTSVLSASATTNELDEDSRAIIITEGFGTTYPETWQPQLKDFTLIGYSENDWAILGNTVNIAPHVYNKIDEDLYSGIKALAGGGLLRNVTIYGIPGTGAYINRGGEALGAGPPGRIKWNVENLTFRRVFRGLHMDSTDCYCTNVEVEAFRDYGVRLGTYNATGACQFARLHVYGGGMSAGDNDTLRPFAPAGAIVPTSYASPAIWIDGDTCQGVDCYAENSPVGVLFRGTYGTLVGLYSHTCWVGNVWFARSHCKLDQARIDVQADSFSVPYDTKAGGTFAVDAAVTIGTGAPDDLVGTIVGVSGTGATGTLTVRHASGAHAPADNDDIVSGGVTALVNGTPVVNTPIGVNYESGSQFNTISNSTIKTIAQTIGIQFNSGNWNTVKDVTIDSYNNPLGVGIDVNANLSGCYIKAHISGGAVGIDFTGYGFVNGTGNYVDITTSHSSNPAIIPPSGWTTTPKTTTNFLRVNGRMYYPATDEF